MQNLKPLTVLSLFFALSRERISIETHSIESRCHRTGKSTVRRRVRASFSPETLQAVAVKGLKLDVGELFLKAVHSYQSELRRKVRRHGPAVMDRYRVEGVPSGWSHDY